MFFGLFLFVWLVWFFALFLQTDQAGLPFLSSLVRCWLSQHHEVPLSAAPSRSPQMERAQAARQEVPAHVTAPERSWAAAEESM